MYFERNDKKAYMSIKQSKETIEKIVKQAEEIQKVRLKAPANQFASRLGTLIQSPESKIFLIKLMDVAFRSKNYERIATFIVRLLNQSDFSKDLFTNTESVLVRLFKMLGYKLPSVSIPLLLKQIQETTSPVVFFVGDKKFKQHYHKRKKEGIRLNVNLIGEALVGEEEAETRLNSYIDLLNQPEVDYISVKISTIYSQLYPLAHDFVVDRLVEKLCILYDEVLAFKERTGIEKFVNLDMEEYRDLSLTLDAFTKTLDKPEYKNLYAGIVIQTYLPNAFTEVLNLQKWAKERVENGGAPIKIRVVKGANMEMELTEASLRDWELPTYSTKKESDANYKRILATLFSEESAKSIHVGVASHNIFDVAFALHLIEQNNIAKFIDFEMLEGLADATVKELMNRGMTIILYTPVVKKSDYNNAIAYLVRRLDEGTQKGNFLKEGYNLQVPSLKWDEMKQIFEESINIIDSVSSLPNRTQNRATETYTQQKEFKNVPDTDWTTPDNRAWIDSVRNRWKNPIAIVGEIVPVKGISADSERENVSMYNWNGALPWNYELATINDYKEAISANSNWYTFTTTKRAEILRNSACELAKMRGDLIGVAVTELGKTIAEVDVEVSEAIDFANFYAQCALDIENEHIAFESKGINLILSPWNFPIAIPIGGVLASLAAGKRAILKPSLNASACSYLLCQCLWNAGVPKDALLFLPAKETTLDPFLEKGNIFDAVILTGGTDTAKFLLDRNPDLNLFAETGGKNAMIVTSLADRDQAITHIVNSAFGNTGQKCSATSLLILEKELFENEHFKQQLKDAAQSRIQGSPWEYSTNIGPLAVPVNEKIKQVLNDTEDEEWLLKPALFGEYMLSPGIKWGITTDDFGFTNELFGPVLFVVKADGLYDAIEKANSVEYGLTSGIETLDNDEIQYWKQNIQAGNLYVNRETTGAIVLRQPFGGIKASCYGFGMKAGGLNYVRQFLRVAPQELPDIDTIRKSYKKAYLNHFSQEKDYVKIRGQHNTCSYLFPEQVYVLIDEHTSEREMQAITIACDFLRAECIFYALNEHKVPKGYSLNVVDNWDDLLYEVDYNTRIRSRVENLPSSFKKKMHHKYVHIYDAPVHPDGRMEFLNYCTEQSYSHNYHRYGNTMGIR